VIRRSSYGEKTGLSVLDRLGQKLSNRKINKALKLVTSRKSLADVGAGFSASLTSPFWKLFETVHLFDISIDKASLTLKHQSVFFYEGDVLETTQQLRQKLDFIVMNNLLEHVEEPVQLLSQVRMLISDEGVLFVNVPSWRGKMFLELAAFRLGLAPREEMEDHRRYYSKRDLWLEIRKAGFSPSKIAVSSSKFGLNVSAIVKN
jgi:2-polyprenyl-3-methyl-5-hydroxy-6-metoxy-1,4-benzoquinol methylase